MMLDKIIKSTKQKMKDNNFYRRKEDIRGKRKEKKKRRIDTEERKIERTVGKAEGRIKDIK